MDLITKNVQVWFYRDEDRDDTEAEAMFVSNNESETIDFTLEHAEEVLGENYTEEEFADYLNNWHYIVVPYFTETTNSAVERLIKYQFQNAIQEYNKEMDNTFSLQSQEKKLETND